MGCIEEGTPFEEMTKAEADAAIKSAEMVFTAHSHYRETGGRVVLSNGTAFPSSHARRPGSQRAEEDGAGDADGLELVLALLASDRTAASPSMLSWRT